MRILLVDDNKTEAAGLTACLARDGYEVDVADSGEAALAVLQRALPDAMIVDVGTPGINGFELCGQIKASSRMASIAVVLLVAQGNARHVLQALAAGADNFVARPLDDAQLLARLARTLNARSKRADEPARAQVEGASFALPQPSAAWTEVVLSLVEDRTRAEATIRERESMLEVERARADEATRAKDDFLSAVSHELRTPLTAVLGWAHLLRKGNVPEQDRPAALARLERSAQAQARLVEDLLDASRITQGGFRIVRGRLDLQEAVAAAVTALTPTATTRQVSLQFEHGDARYVMTGDARRLEQVAWNLIHNGIKFSRAGGTVRVSLQRCANHTFEISVQDDGRGIAPEFMPQIFGRFRQEIVDGDRSRVGLGLGLSIARHLVEAHGGTIAASSEGSGRGARFSVVLPQQDSQPPETGPSAATTATPDELGGVRVLVHETDSGVRVALMRMLEAGGAAVSVAQTPEAIEHALREHAIDVVLCGVSDADGLGEALLGTIRRAGCHAPVAALTPPGRPSARTHALAVGFAEHLTRPVDAHDLTSTLARLARSVSTRLGHEPT